jgi:hypothetical protein
MKKVLLTLIAIVCVASFSLMAQDKAQDKKAPAKKAEMTAEQKAEYKKLVERYDTNKDGKLDKEERAKMTQEDKDAMRKLTGAGAAKKKKQGQ